MLPDYLKQKVRIEVFKCIKKAEKYYGTKFPTPKILFSLRSGCAGRYTRKVRRYINLLTCEMSPETNHIINFNPYMIKHNFYEFINMTPAHEVAHLIASELHNYFGHGPLWNTIMSEVFEKSEKERKTTHSFDTEKKLLYVYKCDCKKHYLSNIRHNKVIKRGAKYRCKRCRTILTFTGQVEYR